MTSEPFSLWYEDFTPTTDEEVRELLHRAPPAMSAFLTAAPRPPRVIGLTLARVG